jgi:hypothetical protein
MPKTTTTTQLPDWVNNASQNNYNMAQNIASRPYTPYPYQRLAGFTGDQTGAMSMLRNFAPNAAANAGSFKAPRMIDSIGDGGDVKSYMSPYIDNVLNRTQDRIRQSTNAAKQWQSNMSAHQDGAFGDARHGIADAMIEDRGVQQMGDAAAEAYAQAYNDAQGMRQYDIGNLFNAQEMNAAKQRDLLGYIDALYRSGSNQQNLDQQSMTLGYEDFLRQFNYPADQLNLLISGLTNSPYAQTVSQKTPSQNNSPWNQVAGILGSVASAFL